MKHPPLVVCILAVAGGCAGPRAPLLTPPETPIVWPKPPDAARLRYLGELKGSADLRTPKTMGQVWDEMIHGPRPPSRLVKPHAVTVHADGNRVAVADADSACVHVFDLGREVYERKEICGTPPRHLEVPVGVAWAGDALWVADARAKGLAVYEQGGRERWVGLGVLQRPAGLVHAPANDLYYVADAGAHAIFAFERDGSLSFQFGTRGADVGQLNCPSQMAVGPDGTLWVVDSLNFRVQHFALDGTPLGAFGNKGDAAGDLALPKGIAVGPGGELWVVDGNFENVQAFTPEGELLMAFGSEGHEPGQFWLPVGVHIDARRRMWVADSYNRRVQVFELLP